jgi:small subunit ribosomal protein S5
MEETKTTNTNPEAAKSAPRKVSFQGRRPLGASGDRPAGSRGFQGSRGPGGPRRGGPGGGREKREVVKPEYESKMINIRRVTRVVAGGRRFAFSVAVVIGNRAGTVGVGVGKAGDTGLAIQKAFNSAKKALVRVRLTKNGSISHETAAKASSARATIQPNFGKGLVAGSSIRTVLELAGITDVTAKVLSPSRNKLNNARVAVAALAKLRS